MDCCVSGGGRLVRIDLLGDELDLPASVRTYPRKQQPKSSVVGILCFGFLMTSLAVCVDRIAMKVFATRAMEEAVGGFVGFVPKTLFR